MRYRHLFLGLLTANAASLLFFYGCDLKSGGDGTGSVPDTDSGFDSGLDAGVDADCPGVDRQTDKENCGACGHSCRGSTCNAGQCVPARFSAISNAGELAVGSAGIVVTTSTDPGRVVFVSLDGDAGSSPVASNESSPKGPSTDGTSICWANGNRVSCTAPDGGPIQATQAVFNGPNSTLIQGTYAYWLVNGNTELKRFPVDGGPTESIAVGDRTSPAPLGSRSLAFDGNRLVWLIRGTQTVYGAPLDGDGGLATTIAKVPSGTPNAVAVGQGAYFVAVEDSGSELGGIYRIPTEGGTATALFRQSLVSPSIAVEGTTVYYTNRANGSVYRFSIGDSVPDGGPAPFASGQASPTSVRTGPDGFLYWANDNADGGLMRVAK